MPQRCRILKEELIKVRGRYRALLEVYSQPRDTSSHVQSHSTTGEKSVVLRQYSQPTGKLFSLQLAIGWLYSDLGCMTIS